MYDNGKPFKAIAAELDINENTLRSWDRLEQWKVTNGAGRIKDAFAERIEKILAIETKQDDDWKELERLVTIFDKIATRPPLLPDSPGYAEKVAERKKPGRPKSGEKNVITGEMAQQLLEEFLALQYPHQKKWWDNRNHDNRNILKGRQLGATFYFALEAFIVLCLTGKNQIFVSASKKQAAQFRRNIIRFVNKVCDLDLQGDPMRIKLPDHENGEAYCYFLGTQVSSVQGYTGDLYLDECAWVRNFDGIEEVAKAMALQSLYRSTYFTTPSTMDHDFYKLWAGITYNRDRPKKDHISVDISHKNLRHGKLCDDGVWRQIVTLEDAVNDGYTLIDLDKVKRKYSPSSYAMLCMCQFSRGSDGVFKFTELHRALVDAQAVWKDFSPSADRPLGGAPVWVGYDPSGLGEDAAAICVLAPPMNAGDKYRLVEVARLDNADYDDQTDALKSIIARYNVVYMGIDNQGVGDGVFQQVGKFFPQATAIRYSPESKAAMVIKMQSLLKRNYLEIDNVYLDDVLPAMLAIQRSTTSGGLATYSAKRSEETGHADVAWALLHALDNADFDTLLSSNDENSSGESSIMFF